LNEHQHRQALDEFKGEEICRGCGEVLRERIPEMGPEWRCDLGKDIERGRADLSQIADITLHDRGLGSTFHVPKDIDDPERRRQFWRMQILNNRRASSGRARTLRDALTDLDKLCESLSLTKGALAEIAYLYRRLLDRGKTAGTKHWLLLTALAYIVSDRRGDGRTLDEFACLASERDPTSPQQLRGLVKRVLPIVKEEVKV